MSTASTHRPTEPPVAPEAAGLATGRPARPAATPPGAAVVSPIPEMRGLSSAEAQLRLQVHGPNLGGGPPAAEVPVVRDGRRRAILAEELVPGDLLLIAPGDVLAADGRLVAGAVVCDPPFGRHDDAPVSRTARAPSLPGDATLQPDLVFAGTTILSGLGLVLVRHTGRRTLRGVGSVRSRSPRGRRSRR